MTQLIDFNSKEKEILLEVLQQLKNIDKWVITIIENYIYNYITEYDIQQNFIKKKYRSRYEIADGEYKEWHPNGQLYLQSTHINDKENGIHTEWYDNGKLSFSGHM